MNIAQSNVAPLRKIFSKNHINTLTYCIKNKKVENIDRSFNHIKRSLFTKDLIDFIKSDFNDDAGTISLLDELPLSGSEKQDIELVEIAFELCHAKKTYTEIEDGLTINSETINSETINSDLKNSLKTKIQNLHKNKDDFDFIDQFCRTGEDVLNLSVTALTEILIFPFELCLGKDKKESTQPETSIKYIDKTNFSKSK